MHLQNVSSVSIQKHSRIVNNFIRVNKCFCSLAMQRKYVSATLACTEALANCLALWATEICTSANAKRTHLANIAKVSCYTHTYTYTHVYINVYITVQ